MISDEERREVAENLRKVKAECEERGYPWMAEDLMEALGFETYEDGEDGIFDRLADLIDPTCTVVWKHTGSYPYEACSVCGGAFEHAPSYYTYCPECGSRLVSNDDE